MSQKYLVQKYDYQHGRILLKPLCISTTAHNRIGKGVSKARKTHLTDESGKVYIAPENDRPLELPRYLERRIDARWILDPIILEI